MVHGGDIGSGSWECEHGDEMEELVYRNFHRDSVADTWECLMMMIILGSVETLR